MNKIEIDIDQYLTEDEKKEIVVEHYRNAVKVELQSERLINNAAFHLVFKMVDDAIDGDSKEVIKNKVLKVFEGLTEYSVIRKKDAWHNDENIGYIYLKEACGKHAKVLEDRVKELFSAIDIEVMRELLYSRIDAVIEDKLTN